MWDDLDRGFWIKFLGLFIAAGIALFILLLLVAKAVYAWGLLGAFLAIAAIALLAAWIHDRREQDRYPSGS
jgi:predicted PurR-regulated permease PerM